MIFSGPLLSYLGSISIPVCAPHVLFEGTEAEGDSVGCGQLVMVDLVCTTFGNCDESLALAFIPPRRCPPASAGLLCQLGPATRRY